MNQKLCLLICFFVGVLVYYLLKNTCGCKVVEGQAGPQCTASDGATCGVTDREKKMDSVACAAAGGGGTGVCCDWRPFGQCTTTQLSPAQHYLTGRDGTKCTDPEEAVAGGTQGLLSDCTLGDDNAPLGADGKQVTLWSRIETACVSPTADTFAPLVAAIAEKSKNVPGNAVGCCGPLAH